MATTAADVSNTQEENQNEVDIHEESYWDNLRHNEAVAGFDSSGPERQRALFVALHRLYRRTLRGDRTPHADRALDSSYGAANQTGEEVPDDIDYATMDTMQFGAEQVQHHFRGKWGWYKLGDAPEPYVGAEIRDYHSAMHRRAYNIDWSQYDLAYSAATSRLRVQHEDERISYNDVFYLSSHLSAQLLLYRLICLFGMPPGVPTDEYKRKFEVALWWQEEGEPSLIEFFDHKGASCCHFYGFSSMASDSALRLLELLIGPNCPLGYDGVLAGCVA